MNPRLLLAAIAMTLGAGGAFADPLPEDKPDNGQPPPVTEQQDVPPVVPAPVVPPPVVPPPAAAQEAQPLAEPDKPAADAAPKSPEEQKAEAEKNVELIAPAQAFSILGKKVHGPDGKDAYGSIIDVLVDEQGQPRAAIIDFGGFLGVGSRKIAVDWQLLKFQPTDQAVPVVLDLDRKQIQDAPEYKDPPHPVEVVEPALVEIPPTPPVPETAVTPVSPADAAAPVDNPPPIPPIAPSRSVAAPAPPPPDAAPPNADKHAD
jgi:hypothetical protein